MIDRISWRAPRLVVLITAGCLFLLGAQLGFYFARVPGLDILRSLRPSSAQVTPQLSPVQAPSHHESSSPNSYTNSPIHNSESHPANPACSAYPSVDSDVVIVVKTGATEALTRIPVQLLTFLSCAKDDVLIFSDMEQDIGGFHIYDALVNVVDKARKVNDDFNLYEMQKLVKLFGEDISSLSKSKEAWALDKYKNIHTAQKAWELLPDRSWYFFIDADTYIVWSSFFAWLSRLDPEKDLYLGRTIHTINEFAHGGSGYAISRAGMLKIVAGEDALKIAADFDISASTTCCGDAELAGALSRKDVSLIDAYPLINHYQPRNIPFGSTYWCQPIITMHHMSPEEVNNVWQFEQSRQNPDTPILFEELFSAHIAPKLSPQRTDWDNLSNKVASDHALRENKDERNNADEVVRNETKSNSSHPITEDPRFWPVSPNSNGYADKSINDCKQACRKDPSCFQYLWDGDLCKLSTQFFSLGEMKLVEGNAGRWVSGWDLERVKEFQRENGHCGSGKWEYHE